MTSIIIRALPVRPKKCESSRNSWSLNRQNATQADQKIDMKKMMAVVVVMVVLVEDEEKKNKCLNENQKETQSKASGGHTS